MPSLIVEWDHIVGEFKRPKQREFPIDAKLMVKQDERGYATLERLDRGIWVHELTTPGKLFIHARAF